MSLSKSKAAIERKEVDKFLASYPVASLSAARLEYSFYLVPKVTEEAEDFFERCIEKTEEDFMYEKLISETADPKKLLELMRKKLSIINKGALRRKIIANEETMLPLIKEKALKNGQDIFIENVLYFFIHSKVNCCDWIIKEYPNMHSAYLRSMLCLVLGFRGEVEMIPFLMNETKRFKRDYPQKTYEQGPLLAVTELTKRLVK